MVPVFTDRDGCDESNLPSPQRYSRQEEGGDEFAEFADEPAPAEADAGGAAPAQDSRRPMEVTLEVQRKQFVARLGLCHSSRLSRHLFGTLH